MEKISAEWPGDLDAWLTQATRGPFKPSFGSSGTVPLLDSRRLVHISRSVLRHEWNGGVPHFSRLLREVGLSGTLWSERKRIEKLRYMHRNPGSPASPVLACWGGKPVKRGLVAQPEQWAWSSFAAMPWER